MKPSQLHWKSITLQATAWLVVALLLFAAVRQIPLASVWRVMAGLRWWQIAVLMAVNMLAVFTFSGRWWALLRGLGIRVGYLRLSAYRLGAFGISLFTPGPHFGGEPLQVILLNRRDSVPVPQATSSVLLDKLLELVLNFFFLAAGAVLTLRWGAWEGQSGWLAVNIAVGLLLLPVTYMLLLWRGRRPASAVLGWVGLRWGALRRRVVPGVAEAEANAVTLLQLRPNTLALALGMSLVSWGFLVLEFGLVLRYLGIDASASQLVAIITAARAALLAPLPGGIGSQEALQVLIFKALGLDPAAGLALSVIIHTRDALFGAVGLLLARLLFRSVPLHNTIGSLFRIKRLLK